MGFLRTASENFVALVFPSRCLICERSIAPSRNPPLCTGHAREIIPVDPPVCEKCGRKMFGESVESMVCAKCRTVKAHYDAGYSTHVYAGALRQLVHLFKYRKRRYLRSFLGGLILSYLREHADMSGYDGIVPVPLHWWRYWTRGFNQAADLAKPLSRHIRIPILKRSLRRVRYTRPQVGLSPKERKSNIRGAFKVSRPAKVTAKRLLLIDDLITSGATLNECARVLKRAGASEVTILTLAHPSDFLARSDQTSRVGLGLQR